jgi:hypothetical protein
MSTDNTLYRQLVGSVTAEASRAGADSVAVAEATVRTWDQMARRLAPIIGEGGFRALYARGLHLTRSKYPWLAVTQEPPTMPFAGLKVSLQRREFTEARDASNALLVTFTELLATFIGEGLTKRLLSSGHADDGLKGAQEN